MTFQNFLQSLNFLFSEAQSFIAFIIAKQGWVGGNCSKHSTLQAKLLTIVSIKSDMLNVYVWLYIDNYILQFDILRRVCIRIM